MLPSILLFCGRFACFAYCHEEIKIPFSTESRAINESPSKTWSRSEYNFTCFAYCHEFCFFITFTRLPGSFPSDSPPHILYKHGVTCVRTVTQTSTWEMINCTSTFDWALNIQYLTHPAVCSVLRRQSKTLLYRKVQEPSSPVLNFKILISLFSCNYRWISAILH